MGTDLVAVSAYHFALRDLLPSGIDAVLLKDSIYIINLFGSR